MKDINVTKVGGSILLFFIVLLTFNTFIQNTYIVRNRPVTGFVEYNENVPISTIKIKLSQLLNIHTKDINVEQIGYAKYIYSIECNNCNIIERYTINTNTLEGDGCKSALTIHYDGHDVEPVSCSLSLSDGVQPMDQDCEGTWSACTSECETAGQRVWTGEQSATGHGNECPPAEDCVAGEDECPPNVDCVGEWNRCGEDCSDVSYSITTPQSGTGIHCKDENNVILTNESTKPCNDGDGDCRDINC